MNEIIKDLPPVLSIGKPANNFEIIEGKYLLIQANAIDDIGIEQVVVNVNGLITGNRTLIDTTFPYEFFIQIPYGQAGKDIAISGSAKELRYEGTPRVALTTGDVVVHVEKDTEAPIIKILEPVETNVQLIIAKHVVIFIIFAGSLARSLGIVCLGERQTQHRSLIVDVP